ncbi:MAG TPA: hypothetical protein VGH87_18610, partial [Polyangiaceae bacterium]
HYVPELEPAFAASYRDFLASLDRDVRVVFVVRRGDRDKLDAFLATTAWRGRSRVIEIDGTLGIWSKDRALVAAHDPEDPIELLIPARPRAGDGSRPSDWAIVPAMASAMGDVRTRELPLAFDAGDFAVSRDRVVFDVNSFARNRLRGAKTRSEVRDRVRALFGRDALMLGSEVGDVPRHHMSMYMALLDHDIALVGDPIAGRAIVGDDYAPGELSPETHRPLRADFRPATIARFDRAAADLQAAGFRVVRIATVPFDDKTYFAYTNGVFAEHVARVPSFGVGALDDSARRVYESLGWRVVPIASRDVYPLHGTIGCLVNVLRRR